MKGVTWHRGGKHARRKSGPGIAGRGAVLVLRGASGMRLHCDANDFGDHEPVE